MTIYNFKRESKLYIVRNNLRYRLDVYPDVSFSQTFSETTVPVKTLHSQFNMFENAVITKANPANFNISIPVLKEADLDIVFQLLLDYDTTSTEATVKSADMYIESASEIYKLEKMVIETGTFQIVKDRLISLNIAGTARKLSKETVIPGVLQTRAAKSTFTAPYVLEVVLGGSTLSRVSSVSLEVRNNIQWVDYGTLHESLGVADASGSIFPGSFVVSSRAVTGNVIQYITDETNSKVNTWEIGTSLRIRTGKTNTDWLLDFQIPSVVFTNRLDVQDIYVQAYDFRMTHNPANLSDIIKKTGV
jgi:hypothetical protein